MFLSPFRTQDQWKSAANVMHVSHLFLDRHFFLFKIYNPNYQLLNIITCKYFGLNWISTLKENLVTGAVYRNFFFTSKLIRTNKPNTRSLTVIWIYQPTFSPNQSYQYNYNINISIEYMILKQKTNQTWSYEHYYC
jgi:hypothetical protein